MVLMCGDERVRGCEWKLIIHYYSWGGPGWSEESDRVDFSTLLPYLGIRTPSQTFGLKMERVWGGEGGVWVCGRG